jgi:N-acetylmuramoyl-L-alanine amidase
MNLDFQREYWESSLQYPDWYARLEKELRQLFFPVVHNDPQLKAFRNKVYNLIEELLAGDKIPLAEDGPDLDRERQPVDTVVIHHTEEDPGMSLGKLSAIGLVRQYGFEYLGKDVSGNRVGGKPVWSGHFREGKMVFFAYHWLIRPDGRAERLLEDAYIGWHAGNWEVNTRSVGIALSGNYEETIPPLAQIEAAAKVIRENYPWASILGHREVRQEASLTCPGAYFLTTWKETLSRRAQLE